MTGLQETNRFWGPQITLNFEPSAIPTWMWAESRTETILIAFKEAIRNGVPVMAHGSCRASQFSQLEANRRNLLNSFTLCKGITCISKSYMGRVPNVSQLQKLTCSRSRADRCTYLRPTILPDGLRGTLPKGGRLSRQAWWGAGCLVC